ncbi:hypothetical protein HFP15_19115 [Amycolatopsis sp. K13G38]|uniref:PH domain-containing protein n=1 Tax=Amycolatopsis acididurans TaxID=2724524 RepID=A0ABX1J9M1_9PSEU|nr:hypothetical protein [Amycolatopsis acididurans]NKQ54997.1 hypothetical protein [Amycolatopsis acididurans]
MSGVRVPQPVQAAADAGGLGAYAEGFRRRPGALAPIVIVVLAVLSFRTAGSGWSVPLAVVAAVVLAWYVLDIVEIAIRRDGLYLYERGFVDSRGFFGLPLLQLRRAVPWETVQSIDHQRAIRLVNLIPVSRREFCEITYTQKDAGNTTSGAVRLNGKIVGLDRAVAGIRTATGIRR